jgi:hypothetical protein
VVLRWRCRRRAARLCVRIVEPCCNCGAKLQRAVLKQNIANSFAVCELHVAAAFAHVRVAWGLDDVALNDKVELLEELSNKFCCRVRGKVVHHEVPHWYVHGNALSGVRVHSEGVVVGIGKQLPERHAALVLEGAHRDRAWRHEARVDECGPFREFTIKKQPAIL